LHQGSTVGSEGQNQDPQSTEGINELTLQTLSLGQGRSTRDARSHNTFNNETANQYLMNFNKIAASKTYYLLQFEDNQQRN
jgi:hypothetical protein